MRALFCLLCLSAVFSCATTQPAKQEPPPQTRKEEAPPPPAQPPQPTPEERQKQLEAMFARERDAAGTQTMTLDGKTVEIEASGAAEVKRDDALKQSSIVFPIGTEEKVQCFVYDLMVPVGDLLGRLTEGMRGKVDIKALRTSAIDVVEKEPVVFADITYLASTEKGKVLGQLKLGVYPNADVPMACLHDEPGYVETFRRAVTKLAGSLARARASTEPFAYRAVYVTSIRGAPVGFERSAYVKAKDGSRSGKTISAMIVPRSQSEWMLQDSAYSSQIAKDGYINEKTVKVAANGEEQVDLVLKKEKAGYSYNGKVSQKDLSGTFKTKDKKGLASDTLVTREIKASLMSGKKKELLFEQYMPDADPTAPLTVTVTKDTAAGPDAVIVETARLKLNGRVDATGDMVRVEVNMGRVTLVQERKFVEGSPD